MPETKPVILKNSKIGYKLGEGDVDLQGMSMNPLESIERAKLKACEKINEITGLSVTLSDSGSTRRCMPLLTCSPQPRGWRSSGTYSKRGLSRRRKGVGRST